MLLAAAAAAVLLAIRLFALSAGTSFAPLASWSRGNRFGALLILLALLLVLVALLVRRPRRPLWLAAEGGGALVRPETVEDRLRQAIVAHDEVLRAQVRIAIAGERPRVEADVAVRPLAEAKGLQTELSAVVRGLIEQITGLTAGPVELKVRVIPVRRLRRYL
jgi:hypothetical protein